MSPALATAILLMAAGGSIQASEGHDERVELLRDWHPVCAEMNDYDFNRRILKTWEMTDLHDRSRVKAQ